MSHFFIHQGKTSRLVNSLSKGVDKAQKYTLTIVSCYFNPESIKKIIDEINEQDIQIVSLDIYVDRGDVLKIGKEELRKWLVGVKEKINPHFYIFNKCYLFHSKAYCLSVHKSFSIGSLVLGSANITGNGLTSEWGNLELLVDTQAPNAIKKFFSDLSNLKSDFTQIESLKDFDTIEDFEHINEENYYLFEYYLLRCGYLVHKWDEKLSFNVVYKLINQNKVEDSEEEEIKNILGKERRDFTINKTQKFITIKYFKDDLDKIKKQYNLNKIIWRDIQGDYGLETIIGYWIPKQIVDYLKKQQGKELFEKFQKDLNRLQENLKEVLRLVKKDWEDLRNGGRTNQDNPVENFQKNFNNIITDTKLLERIYYRYAITELPYHISQAIEIKDMYESLIQTCKKKEKYGKENETSVAVYEAHLTKNLNTILALKVNSC